MICTRGHATVSQALWKIFSPNTGHFPGSRLVAPPRRSIQHRRSIPVNRPSLSWTSGPIDPKSFGPLGYTKQSKDEGITTREVAVVDERGVLGQPQDKNEVLRSFDRNKYFLIQVTDDLIAPVCKIVPREKVYEQERASNSTGNRGSKDRKEIEIPWKAAERDMEHKLKIAAEFLEEGKKVDVVLIARRPREIVKDPSLAQSIVDGVREKIEKIARVTITIAEMNVLGKSFTLHLEGPAKQKIKKKKEERNPKEIEMFWNVTDEEIKKKSFRIAELLASRVPVDLVVKSRKKMFEIPVDEGENILSRVWSAISGIPGIEEIESREGEPGKTVTFFLGLRSRK